MLRRSCQLLKEKTFAFETTAGKFDNSFEKVVHRIEKSLPRNRMHADMKLRGTPVQEVLFGAISDEDDKARVQKGLWGQEEPSLVDKRRNNFESFSPSTHIREAYEKTIKARGEQQIDPTVVKTTREKPEYYYPQVPLEEKVQRRRLFIALWCAVCSLCLYWLSGVLRRARTD